MFLSEQYAALRCATFHAKGHRKVLLPGSAEDREAVADALGRLAPMVTDLAQDVVGARRHVGVMTYAGFEGLWIAPKVGTLEMRLGFGSASPADEVLLECGYLGKGDAKGASTCLAAGRRPALCLATRSRRSWSQRQGKAGSRPDHSTRPSTSCRPTRQAPTK